MNQKISPIKKNTHNIFKKRRAKKIIKIKKEKKDLKTERHTYIYTTLIIMDQSRAFSIHSKNKSRVLELLGAVLLIDYMYGTDDSARDATK